jgi:hypothetical protein
MAEYVRAKSAVTVPLGLGNHVALNAGEVIKVDDTTEAFRDRLGKDPWLENLFEDADKGAYEEHVASAGKLVDPAAQAIIDVEKLTRKRVDELGPDERFGYSEPEAVIPPRMDEGRTLPETGADTPANDRFAEGTADTSEAGKDRLAQGQKMGDAADHDQKLGETSDLSAGERKASRKLAKETVEEKPSEGGPGGVPPKPRDK